MGELKVTPAAVPSNRPEKLAKLPLSGRMTRVTAPRLTSPASSSWVKKPGGGDTAKSPETVILLGMTVPATWLPRMPPKICSVPGPNAASLSTLSRPASRIVPPV